MARTDLVYGTGSNYQIFERRGHPGRYTEVISIDGAGILMCTGSNYGIGAILITGSYSGDIELSAGGIISDPGSSLNDGVYEFSVRRVGGGAAGEGIYLLRRQQ